MQWCFFCISEMMQWCLLWGLLLIQTFSRLEGWLDMDRCVCHIGHDFQIGLCSSNHYQLQAVCPHTTSLMLWTTEHHGNAGWKSAKQRVILMWSNKHKYPVPYHKVKFLLFIAKTNYIMACPLRCKKKLACEYTSGFFSIKQHNLIRGSPSPTLHRSPSLWPDQH